MCFTKFPFPDCSTTTCNTGCWVSGEGPKLTNTKLRSRSLTLLPYFYSRLSAAQKSFSRFFLNIFSQHHERVLWGVNRTDSTNDFPIRPPQMCCLRAPKIKKGYNNNIRANLVKTQSNSYCVGWNIFCMHRVSSKMLVRILFELVCTH